MFSFVELCKILIKFSLDRVINIDELYEEYCQTKKIMNIILEKENSNNQAKFAYEKCHELFSQNKNIKHFLKLFQFIALIPVLNISAERVFSQCNNI